MVFSLELLIIYAFCCLLIVQFIVHIGHLSFTLPTKYNIRHWTCIKYLILLFQLDFSIFSCKQRKKIVYKIEPRTPLKRQRIPVQRFQSPAELEGATKSKLPKEEMTVLYKKGVFLAVRGDDSTGEGWLLFWLLLISSQYSYNICCWIDTVI